MDEVTKPEAMDFKYLEEHCLALLRENSRHMDALLSLGRFYLLSRRFEDAYKIWAQIYALDPQDVHHQRLADVCLHLDRFDEALMHYEKLLKHHPKDYALRNNCAAAYLKKNHHDVALRMYHDLLMDFPEDAQIRENLAHAFMEKERYPEAIHHYQMIPNPDEGVQYALACAFMLQGSVENSLALWNQYLHQDPMHLDARVNRAACLMHLGQTQEALEDYRKILEICPNHAIALHMKAAIEGDTSCDKAKPEAVKALFEGYAARYNDHLQGMLQYHLPQTARQWYGAWCHPLSKKNILDLGCGTGLSGLAFQDRSSFIMGVDLSEKMIEKARSLNIYNTLICDDAEHWLENTSSFFNLVLALEFFNYVGNPFDILSKTFKKISDGGHFLLSLEKLPPYCNSPFRLESSGRFAHHVDHFISSAQKIGWHLLEQTPVELRLHQGRPLEGALILLGKYSHCT